MNSFELLDETISRGNQSYGYTIVGDVAGRRVRAQVLRDCHEQNSYADLCVRADDMTWSLLASEPARAWTDQTRSPRQPWINAITELRPIAQRLLNRATIALNQESPQGTLPAVSSIDAPGTGAARTGTPRLPDPHDDNETAMEDTMTTPESPNIIGTPGGPNPIRGVSDRDILRAAIMTAAWTTHEVLLKPDDFNWACNEGHPLQIVRMSDGRILATAAHAPTCPLITSSGRSRCDDLHCDR